MPHKCRRKQKVEKITFRFKDALIPLFSKKKEGEMGSDNLVKI